jgi:predicted DNA-binding transcriptional regulator YafY
MDKEIKRIRLLKIWEILNRETDEENPIGTEALLEKLANEGIECVRSTLYEDIKTLQKYGYEVLSVRSTSNLYYVADRSISVPEILILMDAVQAAGFITEKKTAELVDKVAKLAGSQRGEVLKRNVVEFTVAKSNNESILYSVSEISQAIVRRKKIRFYYFDYDENHNRAYRMSKKDPTRKRGYKVNPLGTVFDGGYYYLFCYDDFFGGVSHYRIDRMDSVCMLDEEITAGIEAENFDLTARKRQLFAMFGGRTERVEMRADKSLVDVIYDKFGDEIKLLNISDGTVGFAAEVQVSPTFLAWCCSLGDKLKVISPVSVVDEVKAYLQSVCKLYS